MVISRLVEAGGLDRFGRRRTQLAVVAERRHAVAEHERRPHRGVGVLQAAGDEAVGVGRWVGERLGGGDQLLEGLGIGEALVLEQFLVPVDDPVVDREWQRTQNALPVLGKQHAGIGEVAFDQPGSVRAGSARKPPMSASQPPFSNCRFCTW